MKRNNKKVILIITIILICIISIIISVKRENIMKIAKKVLNLNTKEIIYEIYSNENNVLRFLITATDEENGIQEIEYPNGDKILCNGKTQVGIDYVIETNGTYKFTTTSTTGEKMAKEIIIDDNYKANSIIPVERLEVISTEKNFKVNYNYLNIEFDCYYAIGENNEEWIKAENEVVINVDAYDAYHKNRLNEDGTLTLKLKKEDKFGNKVEIKYTENYNVTEDFYHDEDQVIEGESIIACVRDNEIKSGNYILKVNGEEYPAEIYNYDENVNYITNKNLGTIENDQRMVIMKYNKNLNVRENNNVITTQARKKGMFIYVEEELINNGEISMSGKGANAVGQDVYLLKNENGRYEYVPAIGGVGGYSVSASVKGQGTKMVYGIDGEDGINRQTGGGASGDVNIYSYLAAWNTATGTSGSGSTGTSYSGGVGGDSCTVTGTGNSNVTRSGKNGQANGGEQAGGLLIIKTNILNNDGKITANSISGKNGGGSINIFYDKLVQNGIIETKGTSNGGDGCVTFRDNTIKSPKITIDEITGTSFRINIENTNPNINEKLYDYYINDELKIENTTSLTETISSLNYETIYKVYVVLKYEGLQYISNEVETHTSSISRPDLPNYVGTILEYPVLTKDGMKNIKYTNLDDETDYIYDLDINVECKASDALDKLAYDGDESTYATAGKSKFYFGEDIDIYYVCFKIDNNYSGIVYRSLSSTAYIQVGEGRLRDGVFNTIIYGKDTDRSSRAWSGVFSILLPRTYEIYYDKSLN